MEILLHRKNRKDAGMAGCITGRPTPELDFFGFRDVQIWHMDASGRLICDGGDRMDPYCLCFDCRDAFDPKAEIDTQLVNQGHERACYVYASLLGLTTTTTTTTTTTAEPPPDPSVSQTTEPAGFSNEAASQQQDQQQRHPYLMQRTNGGGIEAM